MGSLSNLYISQSYQSLLHFGNNSSASATLVEIQDGVGTGLGIYLNTTGSISASNTITTNNLVVMNDTELSGAFNLNTYFTASTPSYTNSTQPYFNDTVFVTGSYPSDNYPPTIADVAVGWIGNGINVTNGVVTAVSQSVSGYYITMAGQFPQIGQSYRFTGRTSPTAHIYGSLEISENLIVSGTFDIEGKVVVNDNVRINGNLEVSGSQRNTGSLFVSNEISSSTINGIGNVTSFSQSLSSQLTDIQNYTSSLRAAFTASGVDTIFTNNITASNIEVRNNLNVVGTITANKIVTLIESSSIIFSSGSNILGDSILDTQTLNGDVIMSGSASLTGSMGITNNLNVLGNISSSTISGIGNVTTFSQSVDSRLDGIEANYATTGSNSFNGNQTITGSLTISSSADIDLNVIGNSTFSGSVRGVVNALTVTSNTASMNCSLGNFFTVTLPSASATLINPSNILPGETISLRVTQAASGTAGTISFPTTIKFATLAPYVASTTNNSVDIVTFISFDSSSLYAASVKTLI